MAGTVDMAGAVGMAEAVGMAGRWYRRHDGLTVDEGWGMGRAGLGRSGACVSGKT
jgi:hypothetical protein